jgi:hypothetical protein
MVFDPRMRKVIEWFAKWSTPPDSRFGGFRHLPPVGNTYINEPTGEFGIMASIWKEKDPQFAGEMQWMFHQQRSWEQPGIGSGYPAMAGYRKLMIDPSIPEKAPSWSSELFPNTGVMLRNKYPSDRETSLLLLAGSFDGYRSHWDDDSGSVTLWGKGRIVADDFGYNGLAPSDQHNMIDSPATRGVMQVQAFTSTPQFDYVRGAKPGWQRQITFIKDDDPLAPNYFVVRDSLGTPSPATWRMWFTAAKVTPGATSTLIEGKDDVDTDVVFAAPSTPSLKVEDKSVTTGGMDADAHFIGRLTITQTGLVADLKSQDVLAVIYPRLKTQKPPVVTSLANGRAVKIEHEAGTDYVFQSDVPFTYKGDGIEFDGVSGVVKVRGGKAFVAVGEGGELTAFGQTKEGPIPDTVQSWARAKGKTLYNDFEDGKPPAFQKSVLNPQLYEGNPVAGDTTHDGKSAMVLTLPAGRGGSASYYSPISIDPAKKYRLSLKMYAPEKVNVTVGGYGASLTSQQLKNPDGSVWGWGVGFQGPVDNWTTVEATFGPPGSDAKFTFLPDTTSINLVFWCGGTPSPIYVDDLSLEEVK